MHKTHLIQSVARKYFGWMEWILHSNLPFIFCEDSMTRRYTNLEPISAKTLIKVNRTSDDVVSNIEAILPASFPIIFDGWDDGNNHYSVGMYTYIIIDSKVSYILLGLQPPITIGSFTADVHVELISEVLGHYNRVIIYYIFNR